MFLSTTPSSSITDVLYQLFSWNILTIIAILIILGITLILIKLLGDFTTKRLIAFIQKVLNKEEHKLTKDIRTIITHVNSDLAELRIELNADRAFVYHFHNGTQFTHKYPSWKMLNTYTKSKPGISQKRRNTKGAEEVSLIWDDYLKSLWSVNGDKNPVGVYDLNIKDVCHSSNGDYPVKVLLIKVKELSYAGIARIELEDMGIDTFIISPIMDSDMENIIGFIGVDYNSSINTDNINFCKLCQFSARLSMYFSDNEIPDDQFIKLSKESLDNSLTI